MTKNKTDNLILLTTGLGWTEKNKKAISTEMMNTLNNASDTIQLVSYIITPGFNDYIDLFESLLFKGINITLIMNDIEKQNKKIMKKIYRLNDNFNHFYLYDFNNQKSTLHAKIIVVDRKIAIVGSANMTWSALTANHEIAIKIIGQTSEKIAKLIDSLIMNKITKRVESHS